VSPGCCNSGTACQTKHSNGAGQSFFDCVALGTINATQADKARAAWIASRGTPTQTGLVECQNGGDKSDCSAVVYAGACAMWCYGGTQFRAKAHVNTTNNLCYCPGSSIGTTGTWN
jgi:hypothetical protein